MLGPFGPEMHCFGQIVKCQCSRAQWGGEGPVVRFLFSNQYSIALEALNNQPICLSNLIKCLVKYQYMIFFYLFKNWKFWKWKWCKEKVHSSLYFKETLYILFLTGCDICSYILFCAGLSCYTSSSLTWSWRIREVNSGETNENLARRGPLFSRRKSGEKGGHSTKCPGCNFNSCTGNEHDWPSFNCRESRVCGGSSVRVERVSINWLWLSAGILGAHGVTLGRSEREKVLWKVQRVPTNRQCQVFSR